MTSYDQSVCTWFQLGADKNIMIFFRTFRTQISRKTWAVSRYLGHFVLSFCQLTLTVWVIASQLKIFRQHLKILRQYLEIFRQNWKIFRQYLEILRQYVKIFRQYLEIFRHYLEIFRQYLEILDNIWRYLQIFKCILKIVSGNYMLHRN